jgi:CheY-like chemotaxis protein
VQSRIFEPFFTTKRDVGGTGLGLATVHGIARQSGGYVELYSEPGLGTSFKVYIPATQGKPVSLERAQGVRPEKLTGSETLLVCEDDELVRALLETILTENGYRILVASRGEEALELAAATKGQIDALVTDTVMPHMSGLDLTEQLRATRPHVKVVLLSGYSAEVLKDRALPAETVFLQKPFDDATLLQRLRSLLDDEPQLRPQGRRQGSDSAR